MELKNNKEIMKNDYRQLLLEADVDDLKESFEHLLGMPLPKYRIGEQVQWIASKGITVHDTITGLHLTKGFSSWRYEMYLGGWIREIDLERYEK